MPTNRGLLWCGVAAGPLFLAVSTLAGLLRPEYSLARHPVSSLSLTGSGGFQVLNFLLTGALLTAFAVGAHRELTRTGRPGPSTWLFGTYPEGEADYPVGGVSWYEAVAYAHFVGKALPTTWHWDAAALRFGSGAGVLGEPISSRSDAGASARYR
jgi:hypothetical protein